MDNNLTITHERSEPMRRTREEYNVLLQDKFGIDTMSNLPIWRVSWAPSQFEKQHGTFTDFTESGIFIREVTEVREVPKYAHLNDIYILEMLMIVPQVNQQQLVGKKLSYECMHPIMHSIHQTYLPLNWEFIEWCIDCYYAQMGQKSLRKYVSNDAGGPEETLIAKRKRVDRIKAYLYGNETRATDALAYGTGVVVPHKQFGETEH